MPPCPVARSEGLVVLGWQSICIVALPSEESGLYWGIWQQIPTTRGEEQ